MKPSKAGKSPAPVKGPGGRKLTKKEQAAADKAALLAA